MRGDGGGAQAWFGAFAANAVKMHIAFAGGPSRSKLTAALSRCVYDCCADPFEGNPEKEELGGQGQGAASRLGDM